MRKRWVFAGVVGAIAVGAPIYLYHPAPLHDAATAPPNAKGLVALTCGRADPVRPARRIICTGERNYVTPAARDSMAHAAQVLNAAHPGTALYYMETSWPLGTKPMPPHLSHGDGRQADIALYYEDLAGHPLSNTPGGIVGGYGAFEPPRRESERACQGGARGKNERPDPPRTRAWRLDKARTKLLVKTFVEDPKVRRVFIEPHLKARLGFSGNPKVRFAGCQAARHDDHIHVDFY